MTRYLLVIGGNDVQRHAIAARVAASTGMAATSLGATAAILSGGWLELAPHGPWVIGQLFEGAEKVSAAESPGNAQTVTDAALPSTLLTRYWGRYIALWDQPPGKLCILRDPSAALPCYYRSEGGVTLVASDLEMIELASASPMMLYWPEIARILGAGDLRSPTTAIESVLELLPGSVMEIVDGTITISPAWSPWDHVRCNSYMTFDEQAGALRQRIDMVIAALGAAHPNALATVSGGLDSSIVALSLARSIPSLTCLTVATTGPSGDERRYARLVAEAASADYCEKFLNDADIDLQRSQVSHLPRPVGRPFFQSVTKIISDLAHQTNARVVFNGTGGDNVFCFLRSATPVADHLIERRLRQAARSLVDIASLTGASYMEVAVAALRRWSASRRPYHWQTDRRFLSCTQELVASRFEHPWLSAPSGASPGQIAHVAMLLRIQNYLEPRPPGGTVDNVDPLLAQPVVECCLAVPSWQWCRGGVDRALARRAFADVLPAPIQRRRWKGGPDSFIGKLVDANRPVIRAALLEGVLNDRELLDRRAIASVLDDARPLSASDALRLLTLTDAEAWVRLRC